MSQKLALSFRINIRGIECSIFIYFFYSPEAIKLRFYYFVFVLLFTIDPNCNVTYRFTLATFLIAIRSFK